MASSTVQDYVKAIYLLQQDSPTGEATVAGLAATLGVTKGSVTAMVGRLREAGLAEGERYGGVRTTRKGRALALDMIRRHRLIEVFLVDVLGLDWAEVHDEAERLEHAVSKKVLDRLDEFLGRPAIDPHGDPIPDACGRMPGAVAVPLTSLGVGEEAIVARIVDQSTAFLDFAAERGLRPGRRLTVVESTTAAETLTLRADRGRPFSLSLRAAGNVLVTRGRK